MADTKLPKASKVFDSIFEKYCGSIPIDFLRAFAYVATSGTMKVTSSGEERGGLFGVSKPVLEQFDKTFNEKHEPKDLADPSLNTRVACWVIKNIVDYYKKNYPKSLYENWENPSYIALVVHGYNVGYKEPKGIGSAIAKLEKDMPTKVGIDEVTQLAESMKLEPATYNKKGIKFAKSVVNQYTVEKDVGTPYFAPYDKADIKKPMSKLAMAGLVGIPFIAIAGFLMRKK